MSNGLIEDFARSLAVSWLNDKFNLPANAESVAALSGESFVRGRVGPDPEFPTVHRILMDGGGAAWQMTPGDRVLSRLTAFYGIGGPIHFIVLANLRWLDATDLETLTARDLAVACWCDEADVILGLMALDHERVIGLDRREDGSLRITWSPWARENKPAEEVACADG
jgi:hypothetical protein